MMIGFGLTSRAKADRARHRSEVRRIGAPLTESTPSIMSIYATLWKLKFPENGDDYPGCEWLTVTAQGVPGHIGSPSPGGGYEGGNPFAAFLPSPVRTDERGGAEHLRAVVFVTERTPKGTARSAQEYVKPLLVLTGQAYAEMNFDTLHASICSALRGDRPRVVATSVASNGCVRIHFEDGTSSDSGA